MQPTNVGKRNFSSLTFKEVMHLVGQKDVIPWQIDAEPLPPSDTLYVVFERLKSFDIRTTEQAKTLLIDAILAEVVPLHPTLKVWKAAILETDTLSGVADYLIAPKSGYIETPFLCIVEAKRDDFERGATQCLAEMVACQTQDRESGFDTEVYGIVSNGEGWQFYKLCLSGEALQSPLYVMVVMPQLLGILNFVCGECAKILARIS